MDEQLSIEAIHRLYAGVTFDDLRAHLARSFELAPTDPPSAATLTAMGQLGRLVLVAPDGSAEWLIPRPGAFAGVRPLDGEWLEHALDGSPAEVSYQHGLAGRRRRRSLGRGRGGGADPPGRHPGDRADGA